MSDLVVSYSKVNTQEDAYALAKEHITPEFVSQFKEKSEINFDEQSKTVEAQGSGFTLTIHLEQGHAEVLLKLSFLLRALKGKVLGKVEKELQKVL